jgi:hypothetical protein
MRVVFPREALKHGAVTPQHKSRVVAATLKDLGSAIGREDVHQPGPSIETLIGSSISSRGALDCQTDIPTNFAIPG